MSSFVLVPGALHEWATRHNVLHDGPLGVLRLLLDLPRTAG